jgi:BirA family biotin operon repressor/biotin-[acetyl-CoA-carboxylase] ligase
LNAAQVKAAVVEAAGGAGFWRDVIYHERVGSTNDAAKALASRGAAEGVVVVADEQLAGRGRLNRRWVAPPRTSLLCSILFRPELAPSRVGLLTMLCSMAAADAVQQVAELSIGVKWPNDLVVESEPTGQEPLRWRKLAGILTETGAVGDILDFAVVGVGINVNVPRQALPDLAPRATSILAETGQPVDRSLLLIEMLERIATGYARLNHSEQLHAEWSSRLTTLGRRVLVTTPGGQLTGRAEAVDRDGALLVRADDGITHRLLTGDVVHLEV